MVVGERVRFDFFKTIWCISERKHSMCDERRTYNEVGKEVYYIIGDCKEM